MVYQFPLVSIVVPIFNRQNFVKDIVQSLQSQIYENWELIFIDDGSDDNTINEVKKYQEKQDRIQLIIRPTEMPKGGGTCRNLGIKNAEGEFIIFLDSDDLLAEHCLFTRVDHFNKLQDNDFLVYQGYIFRDIPGDDNRIFNNETGDIQDDLAKFLYRQTPWCITGPIWKKDFLIENEIYFNESLVMFQDIDFHLKALLKDPKYTRINENPDFFIREHTGTRTSGKGNFHRNYKERLNAVRKIFNKKKLIEKTSKETVAIGLSNYIFYIARRISEEGKLKKALKSWNITKQERSIRSSHYFYGIFILIIIWLLAVSGVKKYAYRFFKSMYYLVKPGSLDKTAEV